MVDEQQPQQVVHVSGIDSAEAFGTARVFVSAGLEWLVDGYSRAVARFRTASEQNEKSEKETFIPLFEALNWVVAIQDYLQERAQPLDDHALGRALRFARNRVHHAFAAALEVREYPVSASAGPLSVSGTTFDWFWVTSEKLPPGGNRQGEDEYRDMLAGRPAGATLDQLEKLLRSQVRGDT